MIEIQELKTKLEQDEFLDCFTELYVDKSHIDKQKSRYLSALNEFTKTFTDKEVDLYSAPGRSEIGGNHTDHQHGEVLAASINDDAIAIAAPCQEPKVSILSAGYPMIHIDLNYLDPIASEEGTTKALIRGVIAGIKNHGFHIGGFHAYITSDVLSGSGLSSSAAFETILGTILSGLYNEGKICATEIAIIGQQAENQYFGKPCGLMDQMACSVGSLCHMNFAQPENPVITKLDFSLSKAGYSLCITDTKGSHADLTPEYAAIPEEMGLVAAHFNKQYLQEVPEEAFRAEIGTLQESISHRALLRAMHYYSENRRVRQEAEALKQGDIHTFLQLVRESGISSFQYLQNVYVSKDPARQNLALALAVSEDYLQSATKDSKGVARVHGGGFAGTIQAFVKTEYAQEYRRTLDKIFGFGACRILSIRPSGGVKINQDN